MSDYGLSEFERRLISGAQPIDVDGSRLSQEDEFARRLGHQGEDLQRTLDAQFDAQTPVTPPPEPMRGPMLGFGVHGGDDALTRSPAEMASRLETMGGGTLPPSPPPMPPQDMGPASVGGPDGFTLPGGAPPPAAPMMRPSGGGGGGPNLQKPIDAANAGLLGTYDDERGHKWQAALQHDQATKEVAGLRAQEAARQMKAAEDAKITATDERGKLEKYLRATDKLNDAYMAGHLDHNRVFHEADTGTKVAMGVAAFLGAIIPGVKELSDLVFGNAKDDVEAQKDDFARRKSGIAQRDSIFGHFMKVSGDSRLASMQAEHSIVEAQKLAIQSQAERLGTPEALSNAKAGIDELNQKQIGLQKTIAEQARDTAQRQAAAGAAQRAAAEKAATDLAFRTAEFGLKRDELNIKRLEAEGKAGAKDGEQRKLWVPTGKDGKGYFAAGPEDAKEDRSAREAALTMAGVLDSAIKNAEKSNFGERIADKAGVWHTDRMSNLESEYKQLLPLYSKANHLGTLDAQTQKLWEEIASDPGAIRNGSAIVKLKNMRDRLMVGLGNAQVAQTGSAPRPDGFVPSK